MFFKMAAIPTNFHHISAYSGHTVVILMAIPMFLGSRNPVEQSFTHKNALKRTWRPSWRPFCFSKWPLIQPILDNRPISTQNVRRTTCLGLYPGFLGRRIDWNNYLSEIDKLYMKDGIHVFKMAAIPTNFHHISAYSGHTVVILMVIPRFLWSRNPVELGNNHLRIEMH